MDKKKIIIISLIIVAFFVYLIASRFSDLIFGWLNVAVTREYVLTIPEYIGTGLAGAAFLLVVRNARAMEFLADATGELAKVVYPTPKESGQSALVVIVMVGIATVFLALYDTVWSFFTRMVLTVGGV